MKLLRRKRTEPEPAAEEERSEEGVPAVREVGPPDRAKRTVDKDPVTGRWVSLKRM